MKFGPGWLPERVYRLGINLCNIYSLYFIFQLMSLVFVILSILLDLCASGFFILKRNSLDIFFFKFVESAFLKPS